MRSLRKTTTSFIEESKTKHKDKYDYSLVEYTGCNNLVSIICPIHGKFMQKPYIHVWGRGCPNCGIESSIKNRRNTTENYIKEASIKHKNFFSYEKLIYERAIENIIVTCPIHGDFSILANSHLNGTGCKQCYKDRNGFGRTEFIKACHKGIGYIYLIECEIDTEKFHKIGITGKNIKDRFSSPSKLPYKYKILWTREDKPFKIYNLEKKLHKKYRKLKYKPTKKFKGDTECFILNEKILYNDFRGDD